MVPANSESLIDSEVSSNKSQSHDGQHPRNAAKGEELMLTRSPNQLPTSSLASNAEILETISKRKKDIQIGRHPTRNMRVKFAPP